MLDQTSPCKLLSGFGCDDFPIGIARRNFACEGPDVGHVGYLLGVPVDDIARAPTRDGNELGYETDRELRGAGAQLGGRDGRSVDRDEPRFSGLAPALAFADCGVEPVI